MRRRLDLATALLVVAGAGLLLGWALALLDSHAAGDWVWAITTAVGVVPATIWMVNGLRHRQPAIDLVALLALIGTLLVSEYFAGAVICLMLSTGRVLEARARARAERDLSALLSRAPRRAHLAGADGPIDVPIEDVSVGSTIVVLSGEVVPIDGVVASGTAVLDESALTGEPLPVTRELGDPVASGVVNAASPVTLTTTATSEDSTYAGIIRLVRQAHADSAPAVRLAGRYATWFIPFTLAIAAIAWLISGSPVRAVAVLVVATPCPLLLAVPIAIVAGLSRAARRGIVIKGGGALEQLAASTTLLFDKTGTVTQGHPTLVEIVTRVDDPGAFHDGRTGTTPQWRDDQRELLRLAASLDQSSPHVLAGSIVTAARSAGLSLTPAHQTHEEHGHGIRGEVDGRLIAIGQGPWVAQTVGENPHASWTRAVATGANGSTALVYVGIDDRVAGALILADPIREDAPRTIAELRDAGIRDIAIVTGDRAAPAQLVGEALGVDRVIAECTPATKVAVVREAQALAPTIMVGDGINDAPALAAAGVGIALGARGATAASEAADIVITVDSIGRVVEALRIAHRSRSIATQSVLIGMTLAALGMLAAAFGWLAPALGAIGQEAIDLIAIASALRALLPARRGS